MNKQTSSLEPKQHSEEQINPENNTDQIDSSCKGTLQQRKSRVVINEPTLVDNEEKLNQEIKDQEAELSNAFYNADMMT